ncbi:MAG: cupredoxin domain-containing protein [Candidatus Dormibacteria bacterium]
MGIAIALLAPDNPDGTPSAAGLNPFTAPSDATAGCSGQGLLAATPALCTRGLPTHGHMDAADNHGAPGGTMPSGVGPATSSIAITGFRYAPGDPGLAATAGVPQVALNSQLTFTNVDAGIDVYHTVTFCAYPCAGSTGLAYPLADGASSAGAQVDADSGELGYEADPGPGAGGYSKLGPARQTATWTLDVSQAAGFQPGSAYTFFCRVHPFMRGVFSVG